MMQPVPETQVIHVQIPQPHTPSPSHSSPVQIPRSPRVQNWAVTVLIFSIILGLYGIFLELSSFEQMEFAAKRKRNFGVFSMIINGLFCILSGVYGIRAGVQRTLSSAQEYLRMISLNAAVYIAFNGISIIIAVASDDCSDATAEGGVELNCSGLRVVILMVGLIGLAIVMCCCALVDALLADTFQQESPVPMQTYAAHNGAVYTSVPVQTQAYTYVTQPAAVSAFPPAPTMYASVPQYPTSGSDSVDGSPHQV